MPPTPPAQDLIALVADSNQEAVLTALLDERRASLQIRPVSHDVLRHPANDPGVYSQAESFLRPYSRTHNHALVLLDCEWDGSPGDADTIEQDLANRLQRNGWRPDNSLVLAINPEIENWAWRDRTRLSHALGTDTTTIDALAAAGRWWPAGASKPTRPKELLQAVMRQVRRPRSSSVYAELARALSLHDCHDPAFRRLCETLRRWFPVGLD